MNPFADNPWLRMAIEMQSIAQNGLAYVNDPYDQMRYGRLRVMAADMIAECSGLPLARVQKGFCQDSGYHTPKLDCRAALCFAAHRQAHWPPPFA